MKKATKKAASNWQVGFDFFQIHARHFERDLHIVVLGSLDAGTRRLNEEYKKHSTKLSTRLKEAKSAEQEDWLLNDLVDLGSDHDDQQRFLRNMALVALLTKLTHVLNTLIRSAEELGPRDPAGYKGENEFQKLWHEYRARFGVKFSAKHIQWIEPLRQARNRIVHHGGEANPLKPEQDVDLNTKYEDLRELSFSKKYPKLVDGKGYDAQVSINQMQLDAATGKAVELAKWAAAELRKAQLRHAERESKTQSK